MYKLIFAILFLTVQISLSGQSCTFSCPPEETTYCMGSDVAPFDNVQDFIAGGGVLDLTCDFQESTFALLSESSNGAICPEGIVRVYTIDEVGGDTYTCQMIINVDDVVIPVMVCPPDINEVEDIADIPPYSDYVEFLNSGGSAEDNCNLVENSFALFAQLSDGSTCPETYTREYIIEDLCGNSITCSQNIKVFAHTSSFISVSECVSYTSPSGNFTWTESGVYEDVIPNAAGCDSTITIELIIESGIVGNEGSFFNNLACAEFLDEITINSNVDTIRIREAMIFDHDIILRGNELSPPVLEFDFAADDLAGAPYGLHILNGKNVVLDHVTLKEKNKMSGQKLVLIEGSLETTGVVKMDQE